MHYNFWSHHRFWDWQIFQEIESWKLWVLSKLSGFVNESFRIDTNDTNRVIVEFYFPKTNPQNESFEHRRKNRIHETNHLNNLGRNKSMKWIFWKQYGFAKPKPRIRTDSGLFKVRLCSKDSWGFVGFMKKAESLEVQATNQIQDSNL